MSSRSLGPKELVVVGTSHHRAPLELRERLHVGVAAAAALAGELAQGGGETVVLSTCNRTEIYLSSANANATVTRARTALANLSGLPRDELDPLLYVYEHEGAALHLFRVTAGLDSLVLGEPQIAGQVREAYAAAQAEGATGALLDRLFAHALHVGRRVRAETGIYELASSVPAAAAELARRVVGDLAGRRILLIGAGKMSKLAAGGLLRRGADNVFVANHTIARAEELARRFGGEVVEFEELAAELERADVVVSSTRCPRVILGADEVASAVKRRRGRPILFIDIAVPRDLDPAIAQVAGCTLYDLDDLGEALDEVVGGRRGDVLEAEALLADEAARFRAWQASLPVVPAIAALRRRAEAIRVGELARSESRLRTLSPAEREAVDMVTAQIVNKLLHSPTVRMKQAAGDAEGPVYADALRHLFALGDDG